MTVVQNCTLSLSVWGGLLSLAISDGGCVIDCLQRELATHTTAPRPALHYCAATLPGAAARMSTRWQKLPCRFLSPSSGQSAVPGPPRPVEGSFRRSLGVMKLQTNCGSPSLIVRVWSAPLSPAGSTARSDHHGDPYSSQNVVEVVSQVSAPGW